MFSRTNIRSLCEKRQQFTDEDITFQVTHSHHWASQHKAPPSNTPFVWLPVACAAAMCMRSSQRLCPLTGAYAAVCALFEFPASLKPLTIRAQDSRGSDGQVATNVIELGPQYDALLPSSTTHTHKPLRQLTAHSRVKQRLCDCGGQQPTAALAAFTPAPLLHTLSISFTTL